MDFFLKNLRDTIEAVNKLIESNVNLVNTKKIRRCIKIKSSNRSKINFIWRALKILEEEGILALNGISNPKTYKIMIEQKIEVEKVLSKIEKDKKRKN
ncbi:MAG: hypothetical protein ACW98D_10595 [Promethearchaeota archaeon]|jgi:hypothetical protein